MTTEKEVIKEEIEKHVRDLKESFQLFSGIILAVVLLIWIRIIWGNELGVGWIDVLLALLILLAACSLRYPYRTQRS